MSEYEERFDSVSRVYGVDVLKFLRDSHVCVIGIGGVGSWAAESLARTGVGAITLIDGDAISRVMLIARYIRWSQVWVIRKRVKCSLESSILILIVIAG